VWCMIQVREAAARSVFYFFLEATQTMRVIPTGLVGAPSRLAKTGPPSALALAYADVVIAILRAW
jgi:hypothetical protein